MTSARKKMFSGHKSGLQTSQELVAKSKQKFRKRQREELARHSAGRDDGKTVHRDASGKKSAVPATREGNGYHCRRHDPDWIVVVPASA